MGVGGGIVIVPALVFFLNFSQHKAHGTSLAAILVVSAAGVATYYLHGYVDWRMSAMMAVGGVGGAWLGASIARATKSLTLRRVFSAFLGLVGIRMIVGGCLGGGAGAQAQAQIEHLAGTFAGMGVVLATGFASGCASGLLGVGGGIVAVPALVLLLGIGQHTAQGISLGAIIPTVTTGMLMHHSMGHVEFRVAKWIGIGAIGGGVAGASLASSLSASVLKLVFGSFILLTALLLAARKRDLAADDKPA